MTALDILVDLDGVVADLDRGFRLAWAERFPAIPLTPLHERRSFRITDDHPAELQPFIVNVIDHRSFPLALPPIGGAIEALYRLVDQGHRVRICSGFPPGISCQENAKRSWISRHLGPTWAADAEITRDKASVAADLLIDDRPSIPGVERALWQPVVFDQPWNQDSTYLRLYGWSDIDRVVGLAQRARTVVPVRYEEFDELGV